MSKLKNRPLPFYAPMLGDGIDGLVSMSRGSAALVLSDLPSGETAAKFDRAPDFARFWPAVWEALSPTGCAVLMASSLRFAAAVVASQPKAFRYDMVWEKTLATGHLNAANRPLRAHEFVLVFARTGTTVFNPQYLETGVPISSVGAGVATGSENYGGSRRRPRRAPARPTGTRVRCCTSARFRRTTRAAFTRNRSRTTCSATWCSSTRHPVSWSSTRTPAAAAPSRRLELAAAWRWVGIRVRASASRKGGTLERDTRPRRGIGDHHRKPAFPLRPLQLHVACSSVRRAPGASCRFPPRPSVAQVQGLRARRREVRARDRRGRSSVELLKGRTPPAQRLAQEASEGRPDRMRLRSRSATRVAADHRPRTRCAGTGRAAAGVHHEPPQSHGHRGRHRRENNAEEDGARR
jgi:hypothetical protein